jgi:peptidoglycan/LPS O-acetylase OafA/YrhL
VIVIAGATIGSLLSADVEHGGEEPMAVSWALGLLLGSLVPSFEETKSRILRGFSASVAKYSYGIYLTHMLAFRIAFVRVFPTHFAAGAVLGVALTVPMAVLAYHLVESPCIGLGSRLAARFLPDAKPTAQAAPNNERLTAPVSS